MTRVDFGEVKLLEARRNKAGRKRRTARARAKLVAGQAQKRSRRSNGTVKFVKASFELCRLVTFDHAGYGQSTRVFVSEKQCGVE